MTTKNFKVDQGADWAFTLNYDNGGEPLDWTTVETVVMQVRDSAGCLLADVSTHLVKGSSSLSIAVPYSVTADWTFHYGFYDILKIDGGVGERVLQGKIRMNKAVSFVD